MDWQKYIRVDPEIAFGKPVVAGTRIPVYMVLELIEAGFTSEQIIRDYYPTLTPEAIQACLRYATEVIKNEEIHFVELQAPTSAAG
jgi:uncharacterized protein (DUF433 family)